MAKRAKDRRSGRVQDLPPPWESSPSLVPLRLGSGPARSGAATRMPQETTQERPQSRVRQTKPIGPVAESSGDESHPTTVETKPIAGRIQYRTPPGTPLTSVRGTIVSNEANLGHGEALADVNYRPGQHLGTEPASHAPVKTRPIMTDVPRRTPQGAVPACIRGRARQTKPIRLEAGESGGASPTLQDDVFVQTKPIASRAASWTPPRVAMASLRE